MGASKELFIRMSEEEYFLIPADIRRSFLSSKVVSEEKGDWAQNMEDVYFAMLYKKSKLAKKELAEREYQLRELRRNGSK